MAAPTGLNAPLSITFLGAAALFITDGQTRLLADGFFSRPPLLQVAFGRIQPDVPAIRRGLERAGIDRLDAVLVSHAHYDHALDAPEVARRCGALLAGSESSANLARGWGLPERQIRAVLPGERLVFGAFRVTFLPAAHARPNLAAGEIRRPLASPARASAYRDGGCFTLLFEHPAGAFLVQSSAAFLPGALAGVRADASLISLAALGRRPEAYRRAYFEELAGRVGARVVCPIHHDDFLRPPGEEPALMPRWMDDTPAALRSLEAWAALRGVEVRRLPPWKPVPLLPTQA